MIQASSNMMIDTVHEVISTLGIGGAGEVYAIKNTKNNSMFAAKYARKDLKVTQSKKLQLLQRERDTMEELNEHPNILSSLGLFKKRKAISQKDNFKTNDQQYGLHLTTAPFHLIEYCENGSFISYLRNQEVLDESIVSYYTEQLISAVHFIHNKGYVHLDIKLDNILLDNYFNIRVSDFGSALKVDDNPVIGIRRGTTKYMAPEVKCLQEGETFNAFKADMYSLGICLFLMLFKKFPLYKDEIEYPWTINLFQSNEVLDNCPFDCEQGIWEKLTPEIKRIIIALLNKDPDQRPTCEELVQYFGLPIFNESIEDILYQEMEARRSKYEQECFEKKNSVEKQFIQPAVCSKHIKQENCWKPPSNKSGSSTNVTN